MSSGGNRPDPPTAGEDPIAAFVTAERLPADFAAVAGAIHRPIVDRIVAAAADQAIVVGLCGAQGSGKSTMAAMLSILIARRGLRTAVVSLDDLYLTRAERTALASRVHPLLATRGVPGTHEVGIGLTLLDAVRTRQGMSVPRFDKARDDRRPPGDWTRLEAGIDVLLFEGWCVGARPQGEDALREAVNRLEREEDRDGRWRRYVDDALAGSYRSLFAAIDLLVMLEAPGFDAVLGWRIEQEQKLRARSGRQLRIMNDAEVARFVGHYERLTRHMLAEMPARADVVVRLDRARHATLARV